MPLRPIDAIFVQQKDRYYVIYHQGDLYKLPQMKLDFTSWQRREPYIEDRANLRLSKNQTILDPKLNTVLHTYKLPIALHGRSIDTFEQWWAQHSYEWSNKPQHSPKTSVAQTSSPSNSSDIVSSQSTMVANQDASAGAISSKDKPNQEEATLSSTVPKTSVPKTSVPKPSVPKQDAKPMPKNPTTNHDNIFDSMLEDLTNDL